MAAQEIELTAAQEILNERPPKKKLFALFALQGVLFSFFYGGVELVTSTFLQVIIFPLATTISIYNSYRNIRQYQHEKNKSLGKKIGLGLNLLSTLAEATAVLGAVAAYSQMTWGVGFEFLPQLAALVGLQLTTFMVVPAMFVGILGINCLSHLAKTIVHGVKMAHTAYKYGTYTAKFDHHKNEFLTNLRMATVFGVSAAGVGLLLMTPAFHLATLSAGVVLATKIVASSIAGLNAIWTARGVYNMRQAEKKAKELALIPEGSVPEIKPKTKEILQKESDVRDKYKCEDIFKNNLDVHIEDLKRKMSIVHDPKKVMLDFLQEEANVLKKDLSMPELTPILARSSENEEREQEVTKTIAPGGNKFFGDDKRREKVQALVWLKILIQKGSVPVPHLVNGKRPEAGARNLAQRKVLSTMKDLKNYLKDAGMEENVFSSFLKNKGGMQKVFALADYYMDPENKLYKLAANTSATLPRRLAQSV